MYHFTVQYKHRCEPLYVKFYGPVLELILKYKEPTVIDLEANSNTQN